LNNKFEQGLKVHKKKYISWDEYNLGFKKIKNKIQDFNNIHLISIYRGSLLLGQHLSNLLSVPLSMGKFQKYDANDKDFQLIFDAGIKSNETIIILDDLIDSGETMEKAKKYFKAYKTFSVTLYGPNSKDHFSAFDKSDEWLVFPWEYIND
jgi:hypoxanthine phosphoribosyltransferase